MTPLQFQKQFLGRIGDIAPFRQLMDLVPDVAFFMKDHAGRFVMHNRRSCEFFRKNHEREILGKTDYDFFSKGHAALYVQGDQEVMKIGEELDLAMLAARASVSQSQLERRFRQLLGTSPGEYILRVRVNASRELLENTDRTVADIAQAVGFYDNSHFTRSFRRRMSCSPKQYRDQHRQIRSGAPKEDVGVRS